MLSPFQFDFPTPWHAFGFGLLLLWAIVIKGIGLWKAARADQRNWFIAILILSTMGILELIYITWFQKEEDKLKKIQEEKNKPRKRISKSKIK